MIWMLGLVFGALLGAWRGRAAGGNRKDVAQYAAVFALIFGLLGLVLAVIIDRMAG